MAGDGSGHGESGDNRSDGDEVGLLLLLILLLPDLLFRVQKSSPFTFPNSGGLRRKGLGEGRPMSDFEALAAVEAAGSGQR